MIFTWLFPVKIFHSIVFFPLYAQYSSASMSSPLLFFFPLSLGLTIFIPLHWPWVRHPASIHLSIHPSIFPSFQQHQPAAPTHTHRVDLNSVSEVFAPSQSNAQIWTHSPGKKGQQRGDGWLWKPYAWFSHLTLCIYMCMCEEGRGVLQEIADQLTLFTNRGQK